MVPTLPPALEAPLRRYLDLLDRWNRTHALTALAPGERREELLLDAAAALPYLDALPTGARIVDFGTGMGSPAIVLALARPDLDVIGMDSAGKKMAFLRQVALELPVPNLRPVLGRAENLPPFEADLGTAKAVGELPLLLGWWARHGKPGAPFLAFKGPEMEAAPEGWQQDTLAYRLPTRGDRRLIRLTPQ